MDRTEEAEGNGVPSVRVARTSQKPAVPSRLTAKAAEALV